MPYYRKIILSIFDEYKIFAKLAHPLGKLDEKHDDKVADLVWQTIL